MQEPERDELEAGSVSNQSASRGVPRMATLQLHQRTEREKKKKKSRDGVLILVVSRWAAYVIRMINMLRLVVSEPLVNGSAA